MKTNKLRVLIGVFSLMLITLVGCQDDTFLGLPAQDDIPPGAPIVDRVVNKHGSATIYFKAPLDRDLMRIIATYEINGVVYSTSASSNIDSLNVNGFGNVGEYTVVLTCVDNSENISTSVTAIVLPLTPPVELIHSTIEVQTAYGGVNITWNNIAEANVIISVNTKDEYDEWVSLENYYTSSKEGVWKIRGLDSIPQDFQVYVRDRWDNYSTIIETSKTPIYEAKFDKSKFAKVDRLPGDAEPLNGSFDTDKMWDEKVGDNCWHSKTFQVGKYVTFDLGQEVKLSRFKMYQRYTGTYTWLYDHNNLEYYDVYGATELTEEMVLTGDIKHWKLIHKAKTYRPSGLPNPSTPTNEDIAYAKAGDDQEVSLDSPSLRYIRIHCISSWSGAHELQISEMTFWGQVIK